MFASTCGTSCSAVLAYLDALQEAVLGQAEANLAVIMPGYTHLQTAQPVLFSHHMLAYYEMLRRDSGRFRDVYKRLNQMPLGAGALAGTTFPIDREFVAEQLGFDGVTRNSLDSVSDRDFALEFCAAGVILMMHLSRLAEELILWSSADFNFVSLSDAFCTGSSIMPQKKNPDVPELVRGKTGRVYGNLIGPADGDESPCLWPTTRTCRKTRSRSSIPSTPSRAASRSSPT
jgi:argininosuccinate lyase